MRVGIHN